MPRRSVIVSANLALRLSVIQMLRLKPSALELVSLAQRPSELLLIVLNETSDSELWDEHRRILLPLLIIFPITILFVVLVFGQRHSRHL